MATSADDTLYLDLEDILELYAAIIGGTPRQAADQLRNRAGLEGALARPATHTYYEEADLAMQASVLAHGLAEGQFFIDGNKRIALIAMLTFLEINGWRVEASDPQLAEWILGLSDQTTAAELAQSMRTALVPV